MSETSDYPPRYRIVVTDDPDPDAEFLTAEVWDGDVLVLQVSPSPNGYLLKLGPWSPDPSTDPIYPLPDVKRLLSAVEKKLARLYPELPSERPS